MAVFELEGEAKLRAGGGDFAVFDHEVKFDHFGDAQIPQGMRGGLNGDRGRLLLGVGARADELNRRCPA